MRYLAVVSYLGSKYAGWQIQPNVISIQQIIEEKISKILNTLTKIYGSGRTDAGVHSHGQTFHFDSDRIKDIGKFTYSLNSLLPDDIHIISIEKVEDEFVQYIRSQSLIWSTYVSAGLFILGTLLIYGLTYLVIPYMVFFVFLFLFILKFKIALFRFNKGGER